MPKIRRKTFAAREDLIERASQVAKEKGYSFYAFLNENLQQTLQAEELGVSLRILIEERGLLKAAKEASFVLRLAFEKAMSAISYHKVSKPRIKLASLAALSNPRSSIRIRRLTPISSAWRVCCKFSFRKA